VAYKEKDRLRKVRIPLVPSVVPSLLPTLQPPGTPSVFPSVVPSTGPTLSPNSKPKTIAIYIGKSLDDDEMQRQKIKELQSYFGKDLIVATENSSAIDWSILSPILSPKQVILPDSNITLTTKKAFTNYCCGQERAMMWLVENQDQYDYAWVMEDDALWSNMTDLASLFDSYTGVGTDLLHSNPAMEGYPTNDIKEWHWSYKLVPPYVTEQAQFFPPWRGGLFQFYRISSHFVEALDNWRRQNDGEWTFFEALFANLAFRNDTIPANLTTNSFVENPIGYNFYIRHRPCFTVEQVYNSSSRGGLFHPVKKGDPFAKNCMLPGEAKNKSSNNNT
jgi:hypothetical protein